MKCPMLFSGKNKKKKYFNMSSAISICLLLKILLRVLSVKTSIGELFFIAIL